MLNRDALMEDLIRDEGLKLKPYRDTVSKLTVGVGRNLDDRGITRDEALYLLGNDVNVTIKDLDAVLPEWRLLGDSRARALANMMFNLGRVRFCQFVKMLDAIRRHDFEEAARECLESKWASQVGDRAKRIAKMLEGE